MASTPAAEGLFKGRSRKQLAGYTMLDTWWRRLSQLPNQFVLDQNERPPFEDWVSADIGAYRLHTHPKTKVNRLRGEGGEVWVIGTIVERAEETVSPSVCPPGQFVAITDSEVFSDAGSLMQVFFHQGTRTVASSLRLAAPPDARAVPPELLHGSRPDWYWGPRTSFDSVNFLLPSQRLDLASFSVKYRPLPAPAHDLHGEPADMLERDLCGSLRQLASTKRIYLAMTGGLDSRTLFAAAVKAEIDFETYTMASRHVHPNDVEIAAKISARFGVRHRVLTLNRVDPEELDWYLWYSSGETVTLDADFHAAGLWGQFEPDAIHVRGLGFELGRDKYRDFLQSADRQLMQSAPAEIWKKFTRPWVRPLHGYNRRAFDSYARWFAETVELSEMDFRDRLYLEQGIGTWCASAEYGLGATGAQRVSIANSTRIYNLLTRESSGSKKAGPVQRQMMQSIDPGFLDYPFAKPSRAERLRYRAIDTMRALKIRRRLRRLR